MDGTSPGSVSSGPGLARPTRPTCAYAKFTIPPPVSGDVYLSRFFLKQRVFIRAPNTNMPELYEHDTKKTLEAMCVVETTIGFFTKTVNARGKSKCLLDVEKPPQNITIFFFSSVVARRSVSDKTIVNRYYRGKDVYVCVCKYTELRMRL